MHELQVIDRLEEDHIIHVNVNFDKEGVVSDVIQILKCWQLTEFLSSKAGVSLPGRSAQERLVLLTRVWFDRICYVTSRLRILALIDQGEGHAVGEWPL